MEISEQIFARFLEKKLGNQYERAVQEFRKWHPFWRMDVWNALSVVARYPYPTEEMRFERIEMILVELEGYSPKDMADYFGTLHYFNVTIPVILKEILKPIPLKSEKI